MTVHRPLLTPDALIGGLMEVLTSAQLLVEYRLYLQNLSYLLILRENAYHVLNEGDDPKKRLLDWETEYLCLNVKYSNH